MTTPNTNQHVLDFMKLERMSREIRDSRDADDIDVFAEVVGLGITTYSGRISSDVDPYPLFIQDAIEALGQTGNHAAAARLVLGQHAELIEFVDPGSIAYLGGTAHILEQQSHNPATTL